MILTSHRFHDLIIRIIEARLLKAATLEEHVLIFEVAHPSTNTQQLCSQLYCKYLGTRPFKAKDTRLNNTSVDKLGELANIYSHFQLLPRKDRPSIGLPPAGGFLISHSSQTETGYAHQDIDIEPHELFSQICTNTNLFKASGDQGLFQTFVVISAGVIRVWREWLAERCISSIEHNCHTMSGGPNEIDYASEDGLLWEDTKKHVGLRMGVVSKKCPHIYPSDGATQENNFVSYTLQIEG